MALRPLRYRPADWVSYIALTYSSCLPQVLAESNGQSVDSCFQNRPDLMAQYHMMVHMTDQPVGPTHGYWLLLEISLNCLNKESALLFDAHIKDNTHTHAYIGDKQIKSLRYQFIQGG